MIVQIKLVKYNVILVSHKSSTMAIPTPLWTLFRTWPSVHHSTGSTSWAWWCPSWYSWLIYISINGAAKSFWPGMTHDIAREREIESARSLSVVASYSAQYVHTHTLTHSVISKKADTCCDKLNTRTEQKTACFTFYVVKTSVFFDSTSMSSFFRVLYCDGFLFLVCWILFLGSGNTKKGECKTRSLFWTSPICRIATVVVTGSRSP